MILMIIMTLIILFILLNNIKFILLNNKIIFILLKQEFDIFVSSKYLNKIVNSIETV